MPQEELKEMCWALVPVAPCGNDGFNDEDEDGVSLRVRVDIIGHARIKYVGKYQLCMV